MSAAVRRLAAPLPPPPPLRPHQRPQPRPLLLGACKGGRGALPPLLLVAMACGRATRADDEGMAELSAKSPALGEEKRGPPPSPPLSPPSLAAVRPMPRISSKLSTPSEPLRPAAPPPLSSAAAADCTDNGLTNGSGGLSPPSLPLMAATISTEEEDSNISSRPLPRWERRRWEPTPTATSKLSLSSKPPPLPPLRSPPLLLLLLFAMLLLGSSADRPNTYIAKSKTSCSAAALASAIIARRALASAFATRCLLY